MIFASRILLSLFINVNRKTRIRMDIIFLSTLLAWNRLLEQIVSFVFISSIMWYFLLYIKLFKSLFRSLKIVPSIKLLLMFTGQFGCFIYNTAHSKYKHIFSKHTKLFNSFKQNTQLQKKCSYWNSK